MYQKLKSLFFRTNNASQSQDANNRCNKIIFEVTENNDVKIKLNFALSSKEAASNLGIFLNELTTGEMTQTIMDIMIDLSKDYPDYKDLVKHSLLIWMTEFTKIQNELYDKIHINETQESPVISPTQFSTAARG